MSLKTPTLRFAPRDGSDIDRDNVAMVINPFDEIAVEEALRLREAGNEVEIVMVCIGGQEVEKEVRRALAMGADRAIRVDCNEDLSPERVTPLLAPLIQKEEPDLVIMGNRAPMVTRAKFNDLRSISTGRKPPTPAT